MNCVRKKRTDDAVILSEKRNLERWKKMKKTSVTVSQLQPSLTLWHLLHTRATVTVHYAEGRALPTSFYSYRSVTARAPGTLLICLRWVKDAPGNNRRESSAICTGRRGERGVRNERGRQFCVIYSKKCHRAEVLTGSYATVCGVFCRLDVVFVAV